MKKMKLSFLFAVSLIVVLCLVILNHSLSTMAYRVQGETLEEHSNLVRLALQKERETALKEAVKAFEAYAQSSTLPERATVYLVDEDGRSLEPGRKDLHFSEDLLFTLLSGEPIPMVVVENSRLLMRVVRAKDDNFDGYLVYEKDVTDQMKYSFSYLSTITNELARVHKSDEVVLSESLLKVASSAWNPVSGVSKSSNRKQIVALCPFLDYMAWQTEGIIAIGVDLAHVDSALSRARYTLLFVGMFLVAFCAISFVKTKKLLFAFRLCSIVMLASFTVLLFLLSQDFNRFSASVVRGFFGQMEKYLENYVGEPKHLEEISKVFNAAIFDDSGRLKTASTIVTANLKREIDKLASIDFQRLSHEVRGLKIYALDFRDIKLVFLPVRINTQSKNMGVVFAVVLSCLAFTLFVFDFLIKNAENKLVLRRTVKGYLFLLPGLSMFVMWLLIPIVFSLYLSFHEWTMVDPLKPFVGLENFVNIFKDKDILRSLKNTAIYTLNVPIGLAISLGVALLMNKKIKGINLLRLLYFLPSISSFVAISIVWQWIYNPEFGLLNYLLSFFKIPPQRWLSDPKTAMVSIMIMTIWMNLGYQMVIYLAGLKSIPSYLYEVAEIDGANAWHKFVYITLPMLQPTTVFLLITSVIGSFQVFTPVYVMTQGGPAGSTNVIVYHIYNTAWKSFRMGYASAQSWFLFLLIFIASFIQFRLIGKTFYEE